MRIGEIEKAIIERLKAKIDNVQIEGFPEKGTEYPLLHHKGAILVVYAGANYSEPKTIEAVVQERKMQFDLYVLLRNLRFHEGAYEMLEKVRLALTGFRPKGASKMYPVREAFVDYENGIWYYVISFVVNVPAIEELELDELPRLKKITTIDDYGRIDIPS